MKQQEIYNRIMDAVLPRLKQLSENAVYGVCADKFENIDSAMEKLESLAHNGIKFNPPYQLSSNAKPGIKYIIKSIDNSLMANTDDGVYYLPDIATTKNQIESLIACVEKQAKCNSADEYVEHFMTTDELDDEYGSQYECAVAYESQKTLNVCNEYGRFSSMLYFDKELGDAWKVYDEDGIFIDNIQYTGQTDDQLSESIKASLTEQHRI